MRRFVVLCVALALGAVLVGCGGKTVVVVTASPEPVVTATPTEIQTEPAVVSTLTFEEERTFNFIAKKYFALKDANMTLFDSMDDEATSGEDTVYAVVEAIDIVTPIKNAWNRMGWADGEVYTLEDYFNVYVNATTRYLKAWSRAILGTNVNQAAKDAYYARERIERFGPRVEKELEKIRAEYQGY
jgi:hypothetical protein